MRPDPPRVDEVLASVESRLRSLPPSRQERADNRNAVRQAQEAAEAAATAAAAAAVMVTFEDENGVDDNGAMKDAVARVEKLHWLSDDLRFMFGQIEAKMKAAGVKKQYTKFQVLSGMLPVEVVNEVKHYLRMMEDEFVNNDSYKLLKTEILRIFGPKPEAAVERALGRVLTGLPSSLARALVDDICRCNPQLSTCCCPAIVSTLWRWQLSSQVKAGIAHCTFNK